MVRRTLNFEGCAHGQLRRVRQVPNLVDLDPDGSTVGPMDVLLGPRDGREEDYLEGSRPKGAFSRRGISSCRFFCLPEGFELGLSIPASYVHLKGTKYH